MKSKGEILLEQIEHIYSNLLTLLVANQRANQEGSTVVKIKPTIDSTPIEITINSNQELLNEIRRIQNSLSNIQSQQSLTLNQNGVVKTFKRVSELNAEYLENFNLKLNDCEVDLNKGLLEDLTFPIVNLPIELENQLFDTEKVHCLVYDVTHGFDLIDENTKEVSVEYLIRTGKVNATKYKRVLTPKKKQINLFGKFTIEEIIHSDLETNRFTVKLNTLKYGNRFSIEPNILLKEGDILVSKEDTSFRVVTIIQETSRLIIERVSGNGLFKVGIDQLIFNETIEENLPVINLPIKPNKKLLCFFSTENTKYVSFPSHGLKIDTSDYKVTHENVTYTIDEYFEKFVVNFSEYLLSLMRETSIPFSLGIKPDKPVLLPSNFQVVQINKHLVDAKTKKEIEDLSKTKQRIDNEIEYKQNQINQFQSEIDSLKFNSIEEKNYRVNMITELTAQINVLKTNKLTIVRDIDNNATENGLKNINPKYRIIGYWSIQPPIYSPTTKPQNIIKYDVQYRYLSKGSDIAETTSYKMVDNGKEVTVVFSNWNDYQSISLSKTVDAQGNLIWEQSLLESAEDININQCAISINESESVEIRVRAISEAGYPISPMKSEWSDIIRIDFPDRLKNSNLQSTITKNTLDLNKSEFNDILRSSGLLSHISGTIIDGGKTFLHSAKDIASGQYSPEQRNIPLDVMIRTILDEINKLKNLNETNQLSVSFIDFDGETYNVVQNSTLELFAGNYTDSINLTDAAQYGSIVVKRAYIKIKNNSTIPVDVQPLVRNNMEWGTNGVKYIGVPIIIEDSVNQTESQIIYFRNQDLIGINNFVEELDYDNLLGTKPRLEQIKQNPTETETNIISLDADTVKKIALIDNNQELDCVLFQNGFSSTYTDDKLKEEFKRWQLHGQLIGKTIVQPKMTSKLNQMNTSLVKVGFNHELDKFAIGKKTIGAWLYPMIQKSSSIKTSGIGQQNYFTIGANNEVLIPIIFEYRMTDRLGNVYSQTPHDVSFSKKIGVDLLVNNKEFSFDIQVTAKLKSKISSLNERNISSISGAYKSENKENLG